MTLLGIHHAAIIVSNYANSKHFYTKILGLKVIAENYREARQSFKLDLAMPDGSQVELSHFPIHLHVLPTQRLVALGIWHSR